MDMGERMASDYRIDIGMSSCSLSVGKPAVHKRYVWRDVERNQSRKAVTDKVHTAAALRSERIDQSPSQLEWILLYRMCGSWYRSRWRWGDAFRVLCVSQWGEVGPEERSNPAPRPVYNNKD